MIRARSLALAVGVAAAAGAASASSGTSAGPRGGGGPGRHHHRRCGRLRRGEPARPRLVPRRVAADVAGVAPEEARVLEVGCGPGHLSIRLARDHGLEVTGLDLDPAMVERARVNADRSADGRSRRPTFTVGDVASLSFPDGSFDLVVSTLSMHHWADPSAGMAEIARVLRPGGRSLVWDMRPGAVPFHRDVRDPLEPTREAPLRLISATPWRWPLGLTLTQRLELVCTD